MTVADYIKGKFSAFGITLSETELAFMFADSTVDVYGDMTANEIDRVNIAIAQYIPWLMLTPSSKSVSENGHSKSVSFDKDGLLKLYAWLCKKYGLDNELDDDKPTVEFI